MVLAADNGKCNGIIEGAWTGAAGTETSKFWRHLRASGLIPGSPQDITQPSNAYGGKIGVRDGSLGISGHVTIFGQIDGPIAKIIEARLDDSTPNKGRIMAAEAIVDATMDGPIGGAAATYTDDKRYNMAFRL
jgi:hypothetical protein